MDYVFPTGTTIGAGQAIVIFPFSSSDVTRKFALEVLFGVSSSSLTLLGPYTGGLDDGGILRLERPVSPSGQDPNVVDFALMDEVFYSNLPPWPIRAGGDGASLTRRFATLWGTLPGAWTEQPPTPGTATLEARPPGDSSGDGQFDRADIALVAQAGKYRTGQPATFAEGDWNGDGRFDALDIVLAAPDGWLWRTGGVSPLFPRAAKRLFPWQRRGCATAWSCMCGPCDPAFHNSTQCVLRVGLNTRHRYHWDEHALNSPHRWQSKPTDDSGRL